MSKSIAGSFGRVLRKLRKEMKLTQEELGLEAGLQRNFISALELGEKEPSLTTVFKIAIALQISPDELVALAHADLSEG